MKNLIYDMRPFDVALNKRGDAMHLVKLYCQKLPLLIHKAKRILLIHQAQLLGQYVKILHLMFRRPLQFYKSN